ncbi:ribonuclease Y [Candidatus Uabimicrobium sp. HlEnr_7]|uniref:ribonuclease Y n=1 Tax=Candidatus Uabimicrobium helgolandensis TaxID=3095367 RepID=UPI003558ECCE
MDILINIAISLAGVILGFVLHEIYFRFSESTGKVHSQKIIEQAQKQAEYLLKKAEKQIQDEFSYKKDLYEREVLAIKDELGQTDTNVREKKKDLEKRLHFLNEKEGLLISQEKQLIEEKLSLEKRIDHLDILITQEKKMLQEVSSISEEEARNRLTVKLEKELESEISDAVQKHIDSYKTEIDRQARDILLLAMQRCAVEYTAENVITTIELPNEEMKGRIIGREGRNIRTFEKSTGVDVIVDDTPNAVILSAFNPLRREVAKITMEKLILDGRIHPSRIEEVVEQTRLEINKFIMKTGKQVCCDVNVVNINSHLIELIGKMKFHLTMGQSLLQHTLEVVHLTSLIAGELNLNIDIAKRCALLHDIGSVVEDNFEGSSCVVGADTAKKYLESEIVVTSILSHDKEPQTLYAVILQIAHSIIFSRPESRKDSLEKHLKRLDNLEKVALSFEDVNQAYAVDSGRELRCVVTANSVSEERAYILAREIANRISGELVYSGEIKVSLTRETRIIEYSK